MTRASLFAAAPIALALALSACNDGAETAAEPSGEAIANVSAPQGQQWRDVVSATPAGGFVMGNPDAPLKLVEYASVTCSHCAEFAKEADEPLKKDYIDSGRVSYEIRNFILTPFDIPITLLTRCSGPDAYFGLTEQNYMNQQEVLAPVMAMQDSNPQRLQAAMEQPPERRFLAMGEAMGVIDFFKARGVSEDQARACLSDIPAIEKLVAITEDASTNKEVTGTPTFFLNGRKLDGNRWSIVQQELQTAGAR